MTDQEHAGRVKAAAQALNEAIDDARKAGIRVDIEISRGPATILTIDDNRDIVEVRTYRKLL